MFKNTEGVKKMEKLKKIKTQHNICVGHHYAQTNTNDINKTWVLLHASGGKDEPNINIVRMGKS